MTAAERARKAAYPWDYGSPEEATIIMTKPEHYALLIGRITDAIEEAVEQAKSEAAEEMLRPDPDVMIGGEG